MSSEQGNDGGSGGPTGVDSEQGNNGGSGGGDGPRRICQCRPARALPCTLSQLWKGSSGRTRPPAHELAKSYSTSVANAPPPEPRSRMKADEMLARRGLSNKRSFSVRWGFSTAPLGRPAIGLRSEITDVRGGRAGIRSGTHPPLPVGVPAAAEQVPYCTVPYSNALSGDVAVGTPIADMYAQVPPPSHRSVHMRRFPIGAVPHAV